MIEAFHKYYKDLFSSEVYIDNLEFLQSCLKLIPCKVSKKQVRILSQPIDIQEIEDTINSLTNGKSRSPDGIPVEVSKKNMD